VTWERLLAMTRRPTAKELDPPAAGPTVAKPDARCVKGRVLCISKNSRTLSWMIDGHVVSSMAVRFGSQYTPTREGTFSVYWKSRHHVSTLYDSPMPYAMFFSGGQAVHYSSDFAARGYNGASHGCVNVRDEGKIAALFAQVKNGDKVVIHW
jgi:lipoprotein-anchoring transpeptidase ErfK/SrfK